jgi:hypothetical protein
VVERVAPEHLAALHARVLVGRDDPRGGRVMVWQRWLAGLRPGEPGSAPTRLRARGSGQGPLLRRRHLGPLT